MSEWGVSGPAAHLAEDLLALERRRVDWTDLRPALPIASQGKSPAPARLADAETGSPGRNKQPSTACRKEYFGGHGGTAGR